MEENKICINHSLLYEWYALFLEAKGRWKEARIVYHIGISRSLTFLIIFFDLGLYCLVHFSDLVLLFWDCRKAEPLENLKKAQALFIDRMTERLNASSLQKVSSYGHIFSTSSN